VNPTDDGKVPIASAGNFSYLARHRRGQALTWTGSAWAAPTVFLSIGATPSTQGTLRMTGDTNITSKDGHERASSVGTIAVVGVEHQRHVDRRIAAWRDSVRSVNVGWLRAATSRCCRLGLLEFRVSSTIVLLGSMRCIRLQRHVHHVESNNLRPL